jgi:nucleotide-binding universal stress UspA family protein
MDTSHAPAGPRRVVVGVDGSPSSVGALRRGARIAEALHAPLEAVSVWRFPEIYAPVGSAFFPDESVLVDAATAAMDDAATEVFGNDVPAWFHSTVREGNAARVLIEESEEAEMLVVGSRGHGGFVGLLLGSVSEAVAEHASCPVLVFHEDELAAKAA